MPDIHLLTAGDLRTVQVQCRTRLPEYGSWDPRAVTCAACLASPQRTTPAHPGSTWGAMPERELQELVRKTATLQGWHYFHVWNSRHSPSGFPDVVAIRGERLVAAELKREGQEPTPAQRQWLEAFERVRAIETYVWHPEDLPTILTVLR